MKRHYYNRDNYIKGIIPFINKDIIKVLIGQRRVGKSYMLFQLMDYIKKEIKNPKIIYINKELTEFSQIKTSTDLTDYIKANSENNKMNFLFIDEVQDIENFEMALRSLLAEGNFDIYCTGSNAKMLSSDIATYLSGRYIQFNIHSLSYKEFLQFHKLQDDKEAFVKFIKFGGLPYLYHLELEENTVFEYIESIYNTIILRDVVARYNIRNISFLEQLNHFLADNLGSLLSAKRISDFLKSQNINISTKLVLEYLQFLEDAFFIKKVKRFDIKGRKIFEINDKFYFTDLGLRNSLQTFNMKDINKVLENIVFNKLFTDGFEVYIGKFDDKEIDFVAVKGDKTIYIQVAYMIPDEKVHDREFGNLLKIADNHRKIVVSMDDFAESNYKGVEHIHVRKFLLDNLN
ncbi:MAG: ATP-binding protein [Bacteroidales bacterium]|nr:ATP-binding protein [Bacteroidales bacterium]